MVEHVRFARRLLHGMVALVLLAACSSGGGGITQYSATGFWSGTVTKWDGTVYNNAEALIAPDGTLHLAFSYSVGGQIYHEQFFGVVPVTDNYGEAAVRYARLFQLIWVQMKVSVEAGRIQGIVNEGQNKWTFVLTPTARPDNPVAVQGRWSMQSDRLLTDLVVASDMSFTGKSNDAESCSLNGTLSLVSQAWNLYRLTYTASQCNDNRLDGNYSGLAAAVDGIGGRDINYLSGKVADGTSYAVNSTWFATVNVAPVAFAGTDFLAKIPEGGVVALDGRGSKDDNLDTLTYQWQTISAPEGGAVVLDNASSATPNFAPPVVGNYLFELTVDDGEALPVSDQVLVTVAIEGDRFTDNGDGTITDNYTTLVWLKNVQCAESLPLSDADTARLTIVTELRSGMCDLNDNSEAGAWRLPSRQELGSLVDPAWVEISGMQPNPVYTYPALVNTVGTGPWAEGDPFSGVLHERYWTSSPDTVTDPLCDSMQPPGFFCLYYYVDLGDGHTESMTWSTQANIWPVRDPLNPAP